MIDYQEISKNINDFGRYVLECIRNENWDKLNDSQLQTISKLLENDFISIDKPSAEDLELFGASKKDATVPDAPSAHGGRAKSDGMIHIYPYSKSFEGLDTKEIINSCIDDIVVHEIFHYIIRPDVSEQELQTTQDAQLHSEFQHFIAEGLVQAYAEDFSEKHRLNIPKSNYGKNTAVARELLSGIDENARDKAVYNSSYLQLLQKSRTGEKIFNDFTANYMLKQDLTQQIILNHEVLGVDEKEAQNIVKHYDKKDGLEKLAAGLEQRLSGESNQHSHTENNEYQSPQMH